MIRKRPLAIALLAACLSIMLCNKSAAQTKSADERNQEEAQCRVGDRNSSESPVICNTDLRTLSPTGWGRLGRGFRYQYQLGEQFRSVLVGSGSAAQILPNPEHYLNQHSLTFQFGELFRTSGELSAMVRQIADERTKEKGRQFTLEMCRSSDVVACLAGGEGLAKRALSGLSLTASLSERQAVLLSSGFAPEGNFSSHYGVTGQIDFDPAAMFVDANNWENALGAVQNMDLTPEKCFQKRGDPDRDDCTTKLSKATLRGSYQRSGVDVFLEAAIPTFQYKRISQFDFVKNGAILLPAAFPEVALNSYSFTWDLRKLIASRATRLAARSAVASYQAPVVERAAAATAGAAQEVCVTAGESTNFISVTRFTLESCRSVARSVGAERYALACNWGSQVNIGDEVPLEAEAAAPKNNCGW